KAIGVVPASPEAARLLLDAVSYLGLLEGVSIESLARTDLATCLHLVEGAPSAAEAAAPASSEAAGRPLDLLLIPHQEWITPRTVQTLRLGGTLLAPARAAEGARLSPAQRRLLQRRQITLRWIALEALHEPLDSGTLHGALLESGGWLPRLERCGALSSAEISESAERALRRGAAALRDAVPEASMPEEPSLLTGPSLPRMPRPAATAPSASNLMAARRFHLVGAERLEARLDEPLFPLLATDAEGIEEPAYPLLLGGMEALPQPGTARSLRAALEAALEQSGEAFPIVREHLPRLVERAAELASHRPEGVRAAEAFETLWEGLLAEIDASPAAREAIEAELGRAKRLLDLQGYLLSPGPELPLRLALDTLRKRHRRLLEPFLAELATASVRLAEMLRLDSAHDGAQVSADSLSASLGGAADRFFDPGALRRTLPAYRGSTPLGAARRARLEATQATLDAFLDARAFATEVVLVCEDAAPSGLDPEAVRVVVHPDGPAVAVGLFDGLAASFVGVLRALRIARLELEGAYDPALHDEALARFGWRSFEPHEVQLLPRIVVLASAAHLRGPGLGSLSALLRSGRPLQMLVPLADPSEAGALGGAPAELGYLAIAHRDALVVQTTLARPGHLIRGLDRMAETLRPAVAFIGSASWSGIDPGRLAALRHASRETPCFIHDPDGGSSWAERFEFDENPAPERLWLEREIPLLDADGETQSLRAELTSAHADALDPRLRRHFELLRPEQWSAEQIPLADYIREIGEHPPPRVPYLWALDAEGELRRAILTRQLAYACRDRARIWGI
ncbi:MAG: hypothetical protein OEY14_16255, partial [Myxococcales bacterium]|nr:hypothetical protein [Myxococcales bacterium]